MIQPQNYNKLWTKMETPEATASNTGYVDEHFSKHVPIIAYAHGVGTKYNVYITKGIDEPHNYDEVVNLLENVVTEDDYVAMYLTTPGGYIVSAMRIMDAMDNCVCPIEGILSGETASAGTAIAMKCDYLTIGKYANMMLHQWTTMYYGTARQIDIEYKFSREILKGWMMDTYKHFLSEEEVDNMLMGTDIYLGRDDILARWENVSKARELENQEMYLQTVKDTVDERIADLVALGYVVAPPVYDTEAKPKSRVKKK